MPKQKRKWVRSVYILFIFAFIGWIGFSLINVKEGHKSSVSAVAPTPELEVKHTVKGNKLYLVFQLKHFELSSDKVGGKPVYGEGHINLYIDGSKVAQIYKSAYVYPSLTQGKHDIRIELAHHDQETYGITEEFTVDVPKRVDDNKFSE